MMATTGSAKRLIPYYTVRHSTLPGNLRPLSQGQIPLPHRQVTGRLRTGSNGGSSKDRRGHSSGRGSPRSASWASWAISQCTAVELRVQRR
jgi:hypothetical protein